jgi:hypothetical protein
MSSGSQRAESPEPHAHRVGTLLAVNVGMPKDVSWQGKTVFTAVFKDAVTNGLPLFASKVGHEATTPRATA